MIGRNKALRSQKDERGSAQTIFTKLLSSIDFKYECNVETPNLGVSTNINTKSKIGGKNIKINIL